MCPPSTIWPTRRCSRRGLTLSGSSARSRRSRPVRQPPASTDALPVVKLERRGRCGSRPRRPPQRDGGDRGDRARGGRHPLRLRQRRSSPIRSTRRRSTTPASAIPATPSSSAPCRRRGPALRRKPVMMLAGPQLKTVPVTIHMPLREVAGGAERAADRRDGTDRRRRSQAPLRHPRAAACGRRAQPACRRRRRARRRGRARSSRPAVEALRREGIAAFGPLAADAHVPRRRRAPAMTWRSACITTRR